MDCEIPHRSARHRALSQQGRWAPKMGGIVRSHVLVGEENKTFLIRV